MSTSEFDIIRKYFDFSPQRDDVLLAGGDDCAIVKAAGSESLAITTDTLIAGTHFPYQTSARDIACKALMVNFSDLAAMGAVPAWVSLSITLPEVNHQWLTAFSQQIQQLLSEMNVSLIGGDTTRGNLSITVNAIGLLSDGRAMYRSRARPGDKIYVSGTLGDAAVGLHCLQNQIRDEKLSSCIKHLNRPQARNLLAESLRDFCKCAIDISDGLLADLGHILSASQCGAKIHLPAIPVSRQVKYYFKHYNENKTNWSWLLSHGDDYELCFTVPAEKTGQVNALADSQSISLTCIGEITAEKSLHCLDKDNQPVDGLAGGYLHFS